MTLEEIKAIRHELQPWSTDDHTEYLFNLFGAENFCKECGDWHLDSEQHSTVY